jgi:hypothetical protein
MTPYMPSPGSASAPESFTEIEPVNTGDELPFSSPPSAEFKGEGAPAGVVDLEKASQLTEDEIIQTVRRAREDSAKIRRPLENAWRKYEANYYATSDWTEKEDWQAQLQIPEILMKVRSAVASMQGALVDSPDWFTVQKTSQYADDHLVNFIQKWMHIVVDDTDLIDHLLRTWESSFLYGTGWLCLQYEEYVDRRPRVVERPLYADQQTAMMAAQQGMPVTETVVETDAIARGRFSLKNLSVFNVFPDPYANTFKQCKYVITEDLIDEEDLIAGRDAGMYQFDDLGAPMSTLPGERDGSIAPNSWAEDQSPSGDRRRHLVQCYYGNLYDSDGDLVCENWKVVIANERTLLSIGPNPMWSGKFPMICSTPLEHREMLWGRSLVEADANVQEEMTQLTNLILDDIKYSVLGAFMVDESKSDEPGDIDSIEPGRVYRGRDGFLGKLNFTTQSNMAWPVLQHLQKIGDTSTAIGEFTAPGMPTSRGRASATEVQTRSQAGTAYLQQVARRIEQNDVEGILQLIFEYIIQWGGDDSNPKLTELLSEYGGPQLLYDPVSRFKILDQPVKIQAHGISQVMSREAMNVKLMEILNASQSLGMPPSTQVPIFYSLVSNLGLDPMDLGYPPDEAAYQQMLMSMQMAQEQGGAQAGAGNPPVSDAGQTPAAPPTSEQLAAQPMSAER